MIRDSARRIRIISVHVGKRLPRLVKTSPHDLLVVLLQLFLHPHLEHLELGNGRLLLGNDVL